MSINTWYSIAMLLALHAACILGDTMQKEEERPHRMLFNLESPEHMEHMLGGLLESQFNYQLSLRKKNDEVGKGPLLAAQTGFMQVQSFLADPVGLENSTSLKDLVASLEPNDKFMQNFVEIVKSNPFDPTDQLLQRANEVWDPAIDELSKKEFGHEEEHEVAQAFGVTEFFETPAADNASAKEVAAMPLDDSTKTIRLGKGAFLDKLEAAQKKKALNINLTEEYVPSKKTLKKLAKIDQAVDKIAAKINKTKPKPPLPKKKTPLLDKWTKFWGKRKWKDLKSKVENVTLKHSGLPNSTKKPITITDKFGSKVVYFDNKVTAWQKKLEPPKSPDYLKPAVDVLTADPKGDFMKPVAAVLPRFKDPIFKNPVTWSIGNKTLVGVNPRGTSYGPCFVSDSIQGISIQPVMFNIIPRVIHTTAEGINIGPTLINVAPYLIHINPRGLTSNPIMIDINPRLIQVSPQVAWTGTPVPDVLGKPPRKRPSDPVRDVQDTTYMTSG